MDSLGISLWGEIKDSNKLLEKQLEALIDAFEFYTGGFGLIVETCNGLVDSARQKIKEAARELLTPIINQFHDSPLKFPSIPYIQLSQKNKMCNSYFVSAHNYLSAIESIDGVKVFGGVIFYTNQVVFTLLDQTTTQWIQLLLNPKSYKTNRGIYSIDYNTFEVYVREETLNPYDRSIEDMQDDTNDPYWMPSKGRSKVSLQIIYLHDSLSVALIMDLNDNETNIESIISFMKENSHLSYSLSDSLLSIINNQEIDVEESQYLFFTVNETTNTNTRTKIHKVTQEQEDSFSLTINWSHDLFRKKPISKVILRNHHGSYFCRKNMGKEIFFRDEPLGFEEIEDTSREVLSKQNIFLI